MNWYIRPINEMNKKMTKEEKKSLKLILKKYRNRNKKKSIMDDNIESVIKTPEKKNRLCSNCHESGHNRRTCSNPKKEIVEKSKNNISAIQNENVVMDKINGDFIYNEELKQKLSDNGIIISKITSEKPTKNNGYQLQCSEQWIKYKSGTKERSPSSKSDIQLSDNDSVLNVGASIKSGKGRLTSADWCETSAILRSVLENKDYPKEEKDKIFEIITEIIENMKKVGKHKPLPHRNKTIICKELQENPLIKDVDVEWIQLLEQERENCNKLWSYLIKHHEEYVKDILFECASGEYKFGDNCGRAHVLIVTDKNTPDIKEIYSLKKRTEKLDEYLMSQLSPDKSIFACKSGGTGKQMWMRFL